METKHPRASVSPFLHDFVDHAGLPFGKLRPFVVEEEVGVASEVLQRQRLSEEISGILLALHVIQLDVAICNSFLHRVEGKTQVCQAGYGFQGSGPNTQDQ